MRFRVAINVQDLQYYFIIGLRITVQLITLFYLNTNFARNINFKHTGAAAGGKMTRAHPSRASLGSGRESLPAVPFAQVTANR